MVNISHSSPSWQTTQPSTSFFWPNSSAAIQETLIQKGHGSNKRINNFTPSGILRALGSPKVKGIGILREIPDSNPKNHRAPKPPIDHLDDNWWLNHPSSKWEPSPNKGEHKTCLKPHLRGCCCGRKGNLWIDKQRVKSGGMDDKKSCKSWCMCDVLVISIYIFCSSLVGWGLETMGGLEKSNGFKGDVWVSSCYAPTPLKIASSFHDHRSKFRHIFWHIATTSDSTTYIKNTGVTCWIMKQKSTFPWHPVWLEITQAPGPVKPAFQRTIRPSKFADEEIPAMYPRCSKAAGSLVRW